MACMALMAPNTRNRVNSEGRNASSSTRIIACGVFRSAVETLRLSERYPDLQFTFLPSNLHLWPHALKRYLAREVREAQEHHERVICMYGQCFPNIDEFCRERGVIRIPGMYCYEMLLGSERFHRIMDETAGTYFLERELITHFEEYCAEPLELHDEEIREYCFRHYTRVVYVRQPSDPNLLSRVKRLAQFMHLSFEIRDADYRYLDETITTTLEEDCKGR